MASGAAPNRKVHTVDANMFAINAALDRPSRCRISRHSTRVRSNAICSPSTAKCTPSRKGPCRTRDHVAQGTMSHTHENVFLCTCRNLWCCAALTSSRMVGARQTTSTKIPRLAVRQELSQPVRLDLQCVTGRWERSDALICQ